MLQLGGTVVLCRVLPKVKPPFTSSLLSIRAQIAALKMSMVLQASEMLADASIVPAFIRMCGATFGHGCAMGLQAASCRRSTQQKAEYAPFASLKGDPSGDAGGGQRLLLRHRQHLDQRGCRPGEVQRALHHLHEPLGRFKVSAFACVARRGQVSGPKSSSAVTHCRNLTLGL